MKHQIPQYCEQAEAAVDDMLNDTNKELRERSKLVCLQKDLSDIGMRNEIDKGQGDTIRGDSVAGIKKKDIYILIFFQLMYNIYEYHIYINLHMQATKAKSTVGRLVVARQRCLKTTSLIS